MKYPDPNDRTPFVPEPTGQVVNPADVPGGLELLFGEHADEARAIIDKPREARRYVQIAPPPKESS